MKTIRSVTVSPARPGGHPAPKTPAPRHPGASPCGCGGGCECECEETCCQLECAQRPRFICGQLLAAEDLNSMVAWGQTRLGLSRFVDGWGVACGLAVTCGADGPASVGVGPGYAVDCCGRDVVVCEPASIDLSCACAEPEEPCADLGAYAGRKDNGDGPWRVLVDLAIRYAETGSDPQSALARDACGQVSACEFTRVREGFELTWSEGVAGGSPADAAVRRWRDAWDCCCEVVERFAKRFGGAFESDRAAGPELAGAVRRWLLAWIAEHPPGQFCFLAERICALDDDELVRLDRLAPILFALVQDCRNALGLCPCPPCSDADGVPLARICLEAGGGKHPCRVVSIDPYPPYRRPLGTDCCPAPLGAINLGCLVWHREHDACRLLADRGVRVRLPGKATPPPTTLAELRGLCKQDPFARCGEAVCLQVIDGLEAFCLGGERRVIGFYSCPDEPCEPGEQPEPRPVNLDPRKGGPDEVRSTAGGFDYGLGFACVNPNPFAVTVEVVDPLPAPLTYAGDDSGRTARVEADGRVAWRFEVPASGTVDEGWAVTVKFANVTDTVTVENRVRMRATAPDGTEVGTAEAGPLRTVLLFTGRPVPEPEPVPRPTPRPVPEPVPRPTPRPVDLTVINGIGQARRQVLVEAGIRTFADLAATPVERLRELFSNVAEEFLLEWRDEAARRAEEPRT